MKNGISESDVGFFLDGECSPEDAQRVAAALCKDPTLAQHAARLEQLDVLLRSSSTTTTVPHSLSESIDDREYTRARAGETVVQLPVSRNYGRRGFLVGAGSALAASFTAALVAPSFFLSEQPQVNAVDTFFRDFETYLLKDSAVDISTARIDELTNWYAKRLPFALPSIHSADVSVELVGGRLCWLLERRLASLSFTENASQFVIYIMKADGIEFPSGGEKEAFGESFSTHQSSNNSSVMWKSNEQFVVIVGTQSAERLTTIARSLFSGVAGV